jgi:acetyl esterase/lipase
MPIPFSKPSSALAPTASFPLPLHQTQLAINHLLKSGLRPENLYLAGNSCGGNLILEVLSNILHPLPNLSPVVIPKGSRIGGAYLLSPWVSLDGEETSFDAHNNTDNIGSALLRAVGQASLDGVPDSQRVYLDTVNVPEGWFNGVDKVVGRLLVSAGGAELLYDGIKIVHDKHLKPHHTDIKFISEPGGVHDDPYFDFLVGEKKLGAVTGVVVDWFAEGFQEL